MKRVLMPIGIVLACIGIAIVLISNPKRAVEVPPKIVPISVRVIEAREETVQLAVESQGKLSLQDESTFQPMWPVRLSGFRRLLRLAGMLLRVSL